MIGKKVRVTVDRPLGSTHPKRENIVYPINYGYVEGVIGGDGEEQDAYIIGVDTPLEAFEGVVCAVIHRLDDNEDKWVVAPEGMALCDGDILEATRFQEQYFKIELKR